MSSGSPREHVVLGVPRLGLGLVLEEVIVLVDGGKAVRLGVAEHGINVLGSGRRLHRGRLNRRGLNERRVAAGGLVP